tara:strand:+ start:441 stop:3746 length:3306 start_codon:yes stop_codon:yes gene_type:complete
MPKDLFEITMFNAGTICNPAQTDIPNEAASDSLNLDPISEDGKLKGIPENTKLEDAVGHEKNMLLQQLADPTKHDLISYKNSDNNIYAAADIYSGSSTEASLGVLTYATDSDVSMEIMEGAIYLGQGTTDNADPQWIGRLDHGQWKEDAASTLVMEEDTLLPPNMTNETTTACSDGTSIYMANGGGYGNYADAHSVSSLKGASGEITKIRVSDGKVMSRNNAVLGYINAICLSWDNLHLRVLTSQKWAISDNTINTVSNIHVIYTLDSSNLNIISVNYDNNIHALVTAKRGGADDLWDSQVSALGDDDSWNWEDEDSYWGGSPYNYQGHFSDMLELDGTLWICTSAGAIFNCLDITGDTFTFVDRTPLGLGFYYNVIENTEEYMPVGGMLNRIGMFNDSSKFRWLFPACFNGSLMQLRDSNEHVGLYVRNGQTEINHFNYGVAAGTADKVLITNKGLVISISESATGTSHIDGTEARLFSLNDTAGGTRETNNMMYKCPKDVYKSAYSHVKTWVNSGFECNIREFDNPAHDATSGTTVITTTEVEGNDTSQIPLRISDTVIVGLISDVLLSNLQQDITGTESSALLNRNKWRKMSKWTDSSGWTHVPFGDELYLSQRCHIESNTYQLDEPSSYHVANTGYFYRFSFIYDGFQESPLGAAMHIWSNAKKVGLNFTFSTDNFPKRVTAMRVYRATSLSSTDRSIGGFYHYVGEVDITTQGISSLDTESYPNGHMQNINEGDEIESSLSRRIEFTDGGAAGATYETMSGLFEAMTDSNIQYSLSTQLNDSLFVAKCAHHSQPTATNIIYKSLPYKPSLINWALDFLKLPAVPTAIKAFNGRIYGFTEHSTFKIEPNNLFIEDSFNGAGCIGPDAIYVSDYGMCYCDSTNIYLHTGQTPMPIGDSILTSDAGIGYLDLLNTSVFSPKIGFDAKRKSFVIFLTKSKAWSYNIVRKVWNLWDYSDGGIYKYAKGICPGKNGEILLAEAVTDDLFDMFSSATRKSWNWSSKRISIGQKTQNKKWYEEIVAYEGTAPTVDVYWDYDTSPTTTGVGTSETNLIRRQLGNTDTAINRRLLKTKVSGSADTEVDSIGFTFRRFVKLIDQGAP